MKNRYSMEYCGMKYFILNRTTNKIVFESESYDACIKYKNENKIKCIGDDRD